MTELTQEQRTNIAVLASEAVLQGVDLMVAADDRNRLLAALKVLEPHHIIYPEDSDIRECDLCGGETGHFDDCPFAVIALIEDTDLDLPEPIDDGPALRAEFAQYRMGLRLRALLADAPEMLEWAAEMAQPAFSVGTGPRCIDCPMREDGCPAFWEENADRSTWPCHTVPAQLRELAQALRAALGAGAGAAGADVSENG